MTTLHTFASQSGSIALQQLDDNFALALSQTGVDALLSYGSSVNYNSTTINAALAAIGSDPTSLILRPGSWVMNANITIPANVALIVPEGSTITTTGYTLTINGLLVAGDYAVFSGTGPIVFASGSAVKTAWFGGLTATMTAVSTATLSMELGASETISANLTIDANKSLTVSKGRILTIASGQTLTVNGHIIAGSYQIFAGSGTATVNTYPQDQAWWGSAERLDVTALKIGANVVSAFAKTLLDDADAAAARTTLEISSTVPAIRDISRNLVIKNNAVNPGYQIDVNADEIILQDAPGVSVMAKNIDLTLDITTSGANGLDTGSPAAGNWYFIWIINNGSTTAGLLSLSSTDPTMPAGYTLKALVGADYYFTAGPTIFYQMYQVGNHVLTYDQSVALGTETSVTAVTFPTVVPTTAKRITGTVRVEDASSTSAGGYIGPISSTSFGALRYSINGASGNQMSEAPFSLTLKTAQTIYYAADSGTTMSMWISGWEY